MVTPCRRVRSVAFTLIELLVVLAIISLLAAILFPVFAQARESARQVVCASNMRQLGLAMRLYITDYDEVWFPARSVSYPPAAGQSPIQPWIGYDNNNVPPIGDTDAPAIHPIHPGALDPYLHNDAIKRCPSMPASWQIAYALNAWLPNMPSAFYITHPQAAGQEFSPASGIVTTDPISGQACMLGTSDAVVEQPADTLIVWEHRYVQPLCNWLQPYDWLTSPPNQPDLLGHFYFLHRNSATTLWADGHMRRMFYPQLQRPMFSCNKDIYK